MTSKISLFKIMQEDIRQKNWMAVLSILGNFLSLPVFFLYSITNYMNYATYTDPRGIELIDTEKLSYFYVSFFTQRFWAQGVVLIIGAGIVAILGFRYLYSRILSDTWHSLPVSRTHMFFASYLNGLLIWLVPFLISIMITAATAFITLGDPSGFGRIAIAAVKSSAAFIAAFLMVYHLCLAAVMVSGNVWNALVTALIYGMGAAGCYLVICELFEVFIPTFLTASIPADGFIYISPLASAILLLQTLGVGYYQSWPVNLISFAVAMLNLLIAWKLYERRPSELAEHGVHIKWLRISLHFVGTFFTGLFGALLFSLVSGANEIGWAIFGIILGCVTIFVLLDIIFQMNLRAFLRHKLQLAGVTAFTVLVVLSINQDWFGYASRLPSADSIDAASISFSLYDDSSCRILYDQMLIENPDCKTDEKTYDYGMEYRDIDTLYPLLQVLAGQAARSIDETDVYFNAVATVRLQLKNGGTFYRNYPIYNSDKDLVRPILESEEYLNTHYPLSMGLIGLPLSITVSDIAYTKSFSVNEADIQKVMDAFIRDFKSHSSLEELRGGMIVSRLKIMPGLETAIRFYTLNVYDNYTETLSLLRKLDSSMVYTIEDLDVDSLTLSCYTDRGMERDAIYSYFGLEGYPDYDDLLTDYADSGLPADREENTQTVAAESTQQDMNSNIMYSVTITKQDQFMELLPLLHIGNEESHVLFTDQSYIYCGDITTANGRIYPCYVREGELPPKWIDKMVITE